MNITFTVSGEEVVSRRIDRTGEYAADVRPVMDSVGLFLMAETRKNFASEGGYGSGGWKPIQPAWRAEKVRRGLDPRILHMKHRLRSSLTVPGDPLMIFRPSFQGLDYGSAVPYAGAHQNPRPGSHLPRRRPVELTSYAREDIMKRIRRYIMTGLVADPWEFS